LDYDTQYRLSVAALTKCSNDTEDFLFKAIFPRDPPTLSIEKLYVTRSDVIVRSTLDSIMKNKFPLYPGWMAIKDWVSGNIKYAHDSDRHGRPEYYQLPRETIQSGYGDCEDYAILMVSLLRAAGWQADRAYVTIGEPKAGSGSRHAWVRLNVDVIGWQNLEPQSATGYWLLLQDYFCLGDFDDVYGFNDISSVQL
jgi:transglutaminase-like putative cysteine protease